MRAANRRQRCDICSWTLMPANDSAEHGGWQASRVQERRAPNRGSPTDFIRTTEKTEKGRTCSLCGLMLFNGHAWHH